ncbi:hypothetical protein HDU91_004081, partial [Kappamyces sp. JEL0680]
MTAAPEMTLPMEIILAILRFSSPFTVWKCCALNRAIRGLLHGAMDKELFKPHCSRHCFPYPSNAVDNSHWCWRSVWRERHLLEHLVNHRFLPWPDNQVQELTVEEAQDRSHTFFAFSEGEPPIINGGQGGFSVYNLRSKNLIHIDHWGQKTRCRTSFPIDDFGDARGRPPFVVMISLDQQQIAVFANPPSRDPIFEAHVPLLHPTSFSLVCQRCLVIADTGFSLFDMGSIAIYSIAERELCATGRIEMQGLLGAELSDNILVTISTGSILPDETEVRTKIQVFDLTGRLLADFAGPLVLLH